MPSDQVSKRLDNQLALLSALHFNGPMQRGKLSESCHIRKSSVTSIVSELIRTGVLREERPGSFRSPVGLDPDAQHAVAANITPRAVEFARVYLDGRIEGRTRCPVAAGTEPASVIELVAAGLGARMREGDGCVVGAGVALPGVIDPLRGLCLQAVNLYRWKHVPIGEMLRAAVGVDVCVDNDVRCQLWSCTWFDRHARDAENIVYLHLHDGVACAIMTRGRLLTGERLSAGEIGHIRVGDEGRVCTCGRNDCLEAYCSLPAILGELHALRGDLPLATAADVAAAAADEPAVRNVLDRVAGRLARAVAGLVAAIDPATIALGTASRELSDLFKPLLARHLYNELMGVQAREADILTADDVETASLRGAAGMAIQRAFGRSGPLVSP